MATVKAINERFTPEEFRLLIEAKGKQSWHDFILEKCITKPKMKSNYDDFEVDLGDTNKSLW